MPDRPADANPFESSVAGPRAGQGQAPPLPLGLNVRLSTMMLMQYAIWGAWLPIIYPFLKHHRGFSYTQIATMFSVGAVGAIVAPFIAGQVADRWFATEKFLGISHIVGGLLVWQLSRVETYWEFLIFSLFYSLIYSPTLPLTNALAFAHLPDRDRDFGRVRVWGTLGWILAGIAVGQWLYYKHTPAGPDDVVLAAQAAGRADAFRLSAVIGLMMGVYCFALPHTPPAKGRQEYAAFEALSEIKHNPLLLLFLLAVPISCIHQFYFYHTADFLSRYQSNAEEIINQIFGVGGGGLMTVGQMSELFVLALIPLVAKQVPRKALLAIGMTAYALRMFLFGYVDSIAAATGLPTVGILIAGVAMHGLCFGCFIFVAFMIVDEETTADVRASAQGLFNLVIVGIGTIVGSFIAAQVATWATLNNQLDYRRLFSVPMWAAVACLVVLLLFYPRRHVPAHPD